MCRRLDGEVVQHVLLWARTHVISFSGQVSSGAMVAHSTCNRKVPGSRPIEGVSRHVPGSTNGRACSAEG